ncbi:formylglycine-generating enzyme family protein [bacterium]|nr:formylglycine-generating enzyme family protein [bacterium]
MKRLLIILATLNYLLSLSYSSPDQYRNQFVQQDMILIAGGQYQIGSNHGYYDEKPRITIKMSAFFIDVHEVSIKQYREFIISSNYSSEGPWQRSIQGIDESLPVRFVSHKDASSFAKWAGKSLPTAAQWEVACGGDKFPFSETFQKGRSVSQLRPEDGPKSVNFPEVSKFGVLNLSGNVREWVSDWYDRYHRQYQIDHNELQDPTGPKDQTPLEMRFIELNSGASNERSVLKVVKGGSWVSKHAFQLRSSKRAGHNPRQWFNDVGFRCALNLKDN